MSNKMREALRRAVRKGVGLAISPTIPPIERCYGATEDAVNELLSIYGDLEFTQEEVRELLAKAWRVHPNEGRWGPAYSYADRILSRHLGESSDDTPAIKASEIERVTGETVPVWAEWLSQDGNGETWFYGVKPAKRENSPSWDAYTCDKTEIRRSVAKDLDLGPWQDSLRRIIHDEPETASEVMVENRSKVTRGELLEKRVAAIEEALLARGHTKFCEYALYIDGKCTCGYDELREDV